MWLECLQVSVLIYSSNWDNLLTSNSTTFYICNVMFTEICFRFVIYDAYKKELKAREEAAAKDTKKSAPAAESEPARKVSLKDWMLNLLDH